MDDNDGVGALNSVQSDFAWGAMVWDDGIARAQVECGYGSHTVSHGRAWFPVVDYAVGVVQVNFELSWKWLSWTLTEGRCQVSRVPLQPGVESYPMMIERIPHDILKWILWPISLNCRARAMLQSLIAAKAVVVRLGHRSP